ncbi:MAG: alpha/beta hydrolase, partial [Chloroflexi bacterium]|nr:alpha/beta hydrolase [Chloroflexota bacterium]
KWKNLLCVRPTLASPARSRSRPKRHILDQYKSKGGSYEEVVIKDTGHTPFIEKPDEVMAAFKKVLK